MGHGGYTRYRTQPRPEIGHGEPSSGPDRFYWGCLIRFTISRIRRGWRGHAWLQGRYSVDAHQRHGDGRTGRYQLQTSPDHVPGTQPLYGRSQKRMAALLYEAGMTFTDRNHSGSANNGNGIVISHGFW
jgi:hypothetical protein